VTAHEGGRRSTHRSSAQCVQRHVFGTATPQLGGELGMLGLLHERFVRALRRAFLPVLGLQPRVSLGRIEARAYDDYVSGEAGHPVCFNIVRVEPLRGNMLIALPPGLVAALVDAFFGGSARPGARSHTEFTPTEERVIQRLVEGICAGLSRTWADIADLRFTYVGTEANAQLAMLLENDDSVLLCPFAVEVEGEEQTIDLLYPLQMLKPLLPALRSKVQAERVEGNTSWRARLTAALLDVPVSVRAVLAEPTVPLGTLGRLAPGDTIPLQIGSDLRLMAGRTPLGLGALGEADGVSAVRFKTRAAATNNL
jgi:flagellar motor switch protein FliM